MRRAPEWKRGKVMGLGSPDWPGCLQWFQMCLRPGYKLQVRALRIQRSLVAQQKEPFTWF